MFRYLALTLIITLAFLVVTPQMSAQQLTVEDVRGKIYQAYMDVTKAAEKGGNVSKLVEKLNEAISYVRKAEGNKGFNVDALLNQAYMIVENVSKQSLAVEEEAERQAIIRILYMSLAGVVLATLGFLSYRYGPKHFWRLWIKIRGKNKVHIRESPAPRKSMIISGEVWAVILAVMVVASVFSVSQLMLANRVVEPFSELGILGEKMKIGDYPETLHIGEKAKLYIYIGNHMGKPMYYVVQVKIGDKNTPINPSPIPPVRTFEKILLHNQTYIFPLEISINETGLNKRIIVELWAYNTTTNQIEYTKLWGQIWVNVTVPMKI